MEFFSYYGFLPVNEEGKTDMEVEMEKKEEDSDVEEKNHFTYTFHPYYGKILIRNCTVQYRIISYQFRSS